MPDPDSFTPIRANFDFSSLGVGGIDDLNPKGDLRGELTPLVSFSVGFDSEGFFLADDASVGGRIHGEAFAQGDLGPFSAAATGTVDLDATISLAGVDGNGDGKLRIDEFLDTDIFAALDVDISGVNATLGIQLTSDLLDYVDADSDATNNTVHGGDPFRFSASTLLTATVDLGNGEFGFDWDGIRIHNPDVDGDGRDDFTGAVLVENVRLLAQDVIRGNRTELGGELLAAFGLDSIPLVDTLADNNTLSDGLGIAQSLALAVIDNLQVVEVVPFSDGVPPTPGQPSENDTIEDWLNHGLPTDIQEIIRLSLDLGSIDLQIDDNLSFDLQSILPDTIDLQGRAGIENAALSGQIVFGLDTAANPLYLLTHADDLSAATDLGGAFDVFVNVSGQPLGDGLLVLDSADARVRPNIDVQLTGDADGKFRIGDPLSDLGPISVSLTDTNLLHLSAAAATLSPGPLVATFRDDDDDDELPAVSGTINLQTGAINAQARDFVASLQDLIELTATSSDAASAFELTFDPNAAPQDDLLSVTNLAGSIDALTFNSITPSFAIPSLTISHDGTVQLPRIEIPFQNGFADYVGLGGILPVDVSHLTIDFPDPTDLSSFVLGVNGELDFSLFDDPANGSPLIQVFIDDPDQPGPFDRQLDGPFDFEIAVDRGFGTMRPINFGPMKVVVNDFNVPGLGVTMGGDLEFGRLGADGIPAAIPGNTAGNQVAGTFTVAPGGGNQTFVEGLQIDMGGSLDVFAGGSALLDVVGQAQLNTGSGDAGARFNLTVDATRTANPPSFYDISVEASLLEVTLEDLVFDLSPVAVVRAESASYFSTPGAGRRDRNFVRPDDRSVARCRGPADRSFLCNVVAGSGQRL